MNNPEEHTKLDQYLERLMKKQDEIDEKAKNAQIYRDYNVKLLGLLKIMVVGFLYCIFLCACAIGISSVLIAKEYFTYEQVLSELLLKILILFPTLEAVLL